MQGVVAQRAPGRLSAEQIGVAIALLVALLTYGSQDLQFYAYWLVAVLTASLALLFVILNGRVRRAMCGAAMVLGGWTIYALVLTPNATNVNVHLTMIGLTLLYSVFATIVVAVIVKSLDDFLRIMFVCAALWAVVNLALLAGFTVGVVDYGGRAFSGVYFNRNTLAVTGIVLFAVLYCFNKRLCVLRGRALVVVLQALVAFLTLATLSTKGLLGLVMVMALPLWFRNRGIKRIAVVGGFIALSGAVLAVAGGPIVERLANKVAILDPQERARASVGSSGLERLFLMLESAKLIADHPWTGVGVHNSQFHLFTEKYFVQVIKGQRDDTGVGKYSHCNFTEMPLNAGLPGAVLYYFPLWLLWRRTRRLTRIPSAQDVRMFIMVGIPVKLVLDVGMVSYYEFSHILLVAMMWLLYELHLKPLDSVAASWAAPSHPEVVVPIGSSAT